MKIRTIMFAAAAGTLVTAPVALQAANATSLERSSMATSDESELGGGGFGPAIIIAALAAAGMLALILTDNDDDDFAVSP